MLVKSAPCLKKNLCEGGESVGGVGEDKSYVYLEHAHSWEGMFCESRKDLMQHVMTIG